MKLRIGSITFLLFLSSVAFPQATSRYLDKPLPQGWEEDTQIFQQVLPVDDQWWKAFQDPVLDSLISVAVKQNYSVLTAIDRINMAKANLRMERGNFFPTIGLNAGWTRQQSSGNTSDLPQSTQHYYDASLNMSWELDLFGSIRNRVKAQKENFAASKEEYTGTMISLCAQVASAYINLRELQQELAVVQKNCASQKAVLKITEVRYNTGLVSKLDVAQAKSVFFSTKASIPQIESGINQYITTLAILLGTYPQEVRPALTAPGTLPDYMEPIGVGLPADLLLRRPDIRSAERSVNAQAALVGASKSDWLPQVFLKGSISFVRKSYSRLLRTLSCCDLYFSTEALAASISTLLPAIADLSSSTSDLILSIRVLRPAISSSRSCTSNGSSPLNVLISSILDNVVCSWYKAFNFCSTVNSFGSFLASLAILLINI